MSSCYSEFHHQVTVIYKLLEKLSGLKALYLQIKFWFYNSNRYAEKAWSYISSTEYCSSSEKQSWTALYSSWITWYNNKVKITFLFESWKRRRILLLSGQWIVFVTDPGSNLIWLCFAFWFDLVCHFYSSFFVGF